MVSDVVGTLFSVSTTIILASTRWVLVTIPAKVGVGTTTKLGYGTTEIALELKVAKTVLLAKEFLTDAHVLQSTVLAHELLFLHLTFLKIEFLIFNLLLSLAVNIASKVCTVALCTLIELAHV